MRKQNMPLKIISRVLTVIFFITAIKADFSYASVYSNYTDALRPVPLQERQSKDQTTRRGFLKKAAAGAAGLFTAGWLLQQQDERASRMFAAAQEGRLAQDTKRYVVDPCVKFVDGQKIKVRTVFHGLHRSYVNDPRKSNNDARHIARYGRTWIYDSALGGFTELASGNFTAARQTADGLIRLGKMEETRGFKGLWHFSYNTSVTEDSFIDPRGPFGANCWGLKFLLACMLSAKSYEDLQWAAENLVWVNAKIKEYFFGQQVIDETDRRHGLFKFGLYNPDDLARGDDMGYAVWKGNVNAQMEEISIEHNADALDVLRLAALVNQKFKAAKEGRFIGELNKRHNLLMQSLEKLWVGDHYVTGMDASGRLNRSVAVDNNTWVASAILPYNEERAWECIEYTRDNFMTKVAIKDFEDAPADVREKYANVQISGLFFFTGSFTDSVITRPLGREAENMLQPEATYGFIHLLYQFAAQTKDPKRRQEAMRLYTELLDSMVKLQYAYGGYLPYATHRVSNIFNTLPAMAANATAPVVANELLHRTINPYFLGAVPPQEFKVDLKAVEKPTAPQEKTEMPLPGPVPEAEKPSEKEAPQPAAGIQVKNVNVTPNSLEFKVEGVPRGAVATGWVKTDVWYIQPRADSTFELREGRTIRVTNPQGNFSNGKAMIIIYKDQESFEKMNKTMLRDWEVKGEDIKKYILKVIIVDENGKLIEVSMKDLLEKIKFAVVNIPGQAPQLAIDTYLIEKSRPVPTPSPALSTSPYVGKGFLVGGPRGVLLGKTQAIPSTELAGYINITPQTVEMPETMIAGVEPSPYPVLGAIGLVSASQVQAGQAI